MNFQTNQKQLWPKLRKKNQRAIMTKVMTLWSYRRRSLGRRRRIPAVRKNQVSPLKSVRQMQTMQLLCMPPLSSLRIVKRRVTLTVKAKTTTTTKATKDRPRILISWYAGHSCLNEYAFLHVTSTSLNWTFFRRMTKKALSGRATWTRRLRTCAICSLLNYESSFSRSECILDLSPGKRLTMHWITTGPSSRVTSSGSSSPEVSRNRLICGQLCSASQ